MPIYDLLFMARMLGIPGPHDNGRALRVEVARAMLDPIANARAQGRIEGLLQSLPLAS